LLFDELERTDPLTQAVVTRGNIFQIYEVLVHPTGTNSYILHRQDGDPDGVSDTASAGFCDAAA
jgi:hypothetical protein